MIDKALSGLIEEGVLGIIVMILFYAIYLFHKANNSEKDKMRADIRSVLYNKETAFQKERENLQGQIIKLQDRLEGNNQQLVDLARKDSS